MNQQAINARRHTPMMSTMPVEALVQEFLEKLKPELHWLSPYNTTLFPKGAESYVISPVYPRAVNKLFGTKYETPQAGEMYLSELMYFKDVPFQFVITTKLVNRDISRPCMEMLIRTFICGIYVTEEVIYTPIWSRPIPYIGLLGTNINIEKSDMRWVDIAIAGGYSVGDAQNWYWNTVERKPSKYAKEKAALNQHVLEHPVTAIASDRNPVLRFLLPNSDMFRKIIVTRSHLMVSHRVTAD